MKLRFGTLGFTQTDWTRLYNNGKPVHPLTHPKSANLIHWYRMGDGDVYPAIVDRKGTSNGACKNMASSANIQERHP
jgi:hypothetical protein